MVYFQGANLSKSLGTIVTPSSRRSILGRSLAVLPLEGIAALACGRFHLGSLLHATTPICHNDWGNFFTRTSRMAPLTGAEARAGAADEDLTQVSRRDRGYRAASTGTNLEAGSMPPGYHRGRRTSWWRSARPGICQGPRAAADLERSWNSLVVALQPQRSFSTRSAREGPARSGTLRLTLPWSQARFPRTGAPAVRPRPGPFLGEIAQLFPASRRDRQPRPWGGRSSTPTGQVMGAARRLCPPPS